MNSKRIIAFIIVLQILLSVIPDAYASTDGREILEKAYNLNKNLKTFRCRARMKIAFMGLLIPLEGKIVFKSPDTLRVVIPGIPSMLKSRQKLINDSVPRSFNPADYKTQYLRDETLDEEINCHLLELMPENQDKIHKIHLWVEKTGFIIPRSRAMYNDGSEINSFQNYTKQEGFAMIKKQYIHFNFPGFDARAEVLYDNYEINKPVDKDLNE